MSTHTELVDCPRCGEPVEIELEWIPAELPSRDYEALPAYYEVVGNSDCSTGCCLTLGEWDVIDAQAIGQAMDMVREAAR